VLTLSGKQTRVQSGETATLDQGAAKVAPEKAFDDWTGGLAVPWTSALGEKSAIPEIRALSASTEAGTPLVVRSQKVSVEMQGELALTKTRTTYFNGSSSASHALVRFALPPGAILRRVGRRMDGTPTEATVAIAAGPTRKERAPSWSGIEWAGGGWLSGDLGNVSAGDTIDLDLEYAEWLPTRADRATYRFPMAGGDEPPVVGELGIEVDASRTVTPFITASAGAVVKDRVVHYRQADVRPAGDLVVELAPQVVRSGMARGYVVNAKAGQDPYVMVRTELPVRRDSGVTLAFVVDSSMSIGAATLETERAVIDAVLEGLGPRDSLVVLAADQTVRPMGPATPTPVTPALRAEVRKALGALREGGASNLGAALQSAADLLDSPSRGDRAGSGMVVYVGDGRPSVGEPDAEHVRRLLQRRVGGMPRLGAISVGSGADRFALARLVAGVGAVYDVLDRSDAARAGATLLADALEPTLRDVELDLGPTVDRIYPRDARAILAGSTVTLLGRLRGKLPTRIGFRFRDGSKLIEESRLLYPTPLPRDHDVPQRWALARIEEMSARDEGIEPAIALAVEARLLTPWTSWFFSSPGGTASSLPFAERVLELSPAFDASFAARVEEIGPAGSTLLEPPRSFQGGVSLAEATEAAVRRILRRASGAIRACRDARAAVRPDIGSAFTVDLRVDGDGHASQVHLVLAEGRGEDAALERCIRGVVQSLPFFASGMPVSLKELLKLPEERGSRRTRCSEASKVSLPLRKSIWRARGSLDTQAYLVAAGGCELPRWPDRRAFLLLALEQRSLGQSRLELASDLEAAGEGDAAAFVRNETLRRVTSFEELDLLSRLLREDEPDIGDELDKAYKKATTDGERLAVVRRFLILSPHSGLARRRLLSLLEALGQKETLVAEIGSLRGEPFLDAGLLAQGASALRRLGLDGEGRRVFGELIERAPRDPWTLAYVGDRLRAEGMFDEAGAAYDSLARSMPNDAGVTLRMALAHAGAGRVDVATRLLERVTQTGGRGDDGRLGELSSIAEAVLLAGARGGKDADVEAQLERRLLQTPLPDVESIVMVQSPPADDPVEVSVLRERGEKAEQSADLDAKVLGLSAIRIERGDGAARILLRRPAAPGPSRPAKASVLALVLGRERGTPTLISREIDVPGDGKAVELRFEGGAFL
jgi:hypothetical protein